MCAFVRASESTSELDKWIIATLTILFPRCQCRHMVQLLKCFRGAIVHGLQGYSLLKLNGSRFYFLSPQAECRRLLFYCRLTDEKTTGSLSNCSPSPLPWELKCLCPMGATISPLLRPLRKTPFGSVWKMSSIQMNYNHNPSRKAKLEDSKHMSLKNINMNFSPLSWLTLHCMRLVK